MVLRIGYESKNNHFNPLVKKTILWVRFNSSLSLKCIMRPYDQPNTDEPFKE